MLTSDPSLSTPSYEQGQNGRGRELVSGTKVDGELRSTGMNTNVETHAPSQPSLQSAFALAPFCVGIAALVGSLFSVLLGQVMAGLTLACWGLLLVPVGLVVVAFVRKLRHVGLRGGLILAGGSAWLAALWPWAMQLTLFPIGDSVTTACSLALGEQGVRSTQLLVNIQLFPPALLCRPDGTSSVPIYATPTAITVLWVALLVACLAGILFGLALVARRLTCVRQDRSLM